jgi:biotin transporter BioY
MDLVPAFLAGFGGFFLGMLLASRVIGWLQAIIEARKATHVNADAGTATHITLPLAAVLHSGPWLLGGTMWWAYFVLAKPHSAEWVWFFSGIVVAPLVLVPTAIVISLRKKNAKVEGEN